MTPRDRRARHGSGKPAPAPTLCVEPEPAPPLAPPVFAVPFERKVLVGREKALAALNSAFATPRRTTIGPAVAIGGVGGIGKTTTAGTSR